MQFNCPGLFPAAFGPLVEFCVIVSSQAAYMCFLSVQTDRTHWAVCVRRAEWDAGGSGVGGCFAVARAGLPSWG